MGGNGCEGGSGGGMENYLTYGKLLKPEGGGSELLIKSYVMR